MTTSPNPSNSPSPDADAAALFQSLRRKEGTWSDWGRGCQTLQKAGYSPQAIFEETGIEPIQQNQIVVASQVLASILEVGVTEEVRSRFERTGSDTLYELRILNQVGRAAAATLIVQMGIDSEGAHEVAKALKDFSRYKTPPEQFPDYPGDAIAYYYWRLARQQSELQMRSRLIAQALRFARSETARKEVEKLLTDFTVSRSVTAPRLPFYRLESEEEVPKVLPVAGRLPLTVADYKAVPVVVEEGPFSLVAFSGSGAWVPIPGWQVVINSEDPVVLLSTSDQLPNTEHDTVEEILIVVDRAQREWDQRSYFVVEQDGELQLSWFAEDPGVPLLGQVVLILRPKKVLDEDYNKDLWQIDE